MALRVFAEVDCELKLAVVACESFRFLVISLLYAYHKVGANQQGKQVQNLVKKGRNVNSQDKASAAKHQEKAICGECGGSGHFAGAGQVSELFEAIFQGEGEHEVENAENKKCHGRERLDGIVTLLEVVGCILRRDGDKCYLSALFLKSNGLWCCITLFLRLGDAISDDVAEQGGEEH